VPSTQTLFNVEGFVLNTFSNLALLNEINEMPYFCTVVFVLSVQWEEFFIYRVSTINGLAVGNGLQ
jgi:hypothetical protein